MMGDFSRFYKDNIRLFLRFGLRFIDDQDVVEDIVQDCFVSLWERFQSFDGDEAYSKAFLYTSIRNRSLNYIRDKKVAEKNISKLSLLQSETDFTAIAVEEEIYDFLQQKINQLSPMQRDVIRLHLTGIDNHEIAAALNISVNTVLTHKQRARQILKSYIDHFLMVLINFI